MKELNRYSILDDGTTSKSDSSGLVFVHPRFGKVADFDESGFQVVGTYVDTFRQIFKGAVNPYFLHDIDESLSFNAKVYDFHESVWLLGKSSKSSGYQYRLQNNELGLIIFFKMFHSKAENSCSHLKFECSLWFLDSRTPKEVDDYLALLASKILIDPIPHFPAVHLPVIFKVGNLILI